MPSSPDPMFAGLGQALRVGTQMLASLIVGGGLGWGADVYLFATAPWGMAAGLTLGLIAGIRGARRAAQQWQWK